MDKKNLTLIFVNIDDKDQIGRDVFLVPYYLGKKNNLHVTIVCPQTDVLKDITEIRGVDIVQVPYLKDIKITPAPDFYLSYSVLKYLLYNSKKIDYLMSFFCHRDTLICNFFYKIINRRGFSYIKSDGAEILLEISKLPSWKKNIYKFLISKVDIISIEIRSLYENLLDIYPEYKNKFIYMPNGFDEEMLQNYGIKEKPFFEKENLFITVARLGTYPKNTEMLLDALTKIELRDWKVMLIGPIEKEEQNFQQKINEFYIKNPLLRDKVIFTGSIYDKKILWEYYNKAKSFLLTSRYESYGIVLSEAYRFSNYIITTDVGGARDILEDGFGEIISNEVELKDSMQSIIDGKVDLTDLYSKHHKKDVSWSNFLDELSFKMKNK